ncbi:helix-turn-helix domain-containing protein [Pseudobutyrivibrio sp.]|uniref:helix-turn-helix domain-containing protein n=1 Tax=Pseudobutyrivibrio sp. TaxID=2014367 RepID=UPI001E0D915F|nr:helix-turn-helix domain-containing protein [Pseudobutyrivibrio sp.]MBE5912301.1 helix-turn-helix domain-containing protein [Pseudobutyrivibrio sp.]
MKCKLSIREKLKDLRIEKGLSLQELSEQTGISRASLGNYETDDYKEISHKSIITLADFYGVTSDYLLGLTENREQHPFPVDELGLDDETINLLKSGKLNVRLICEMIKHPDYINFISDMEIYVDNLAGMQFRNINKMIEQTRVRLQNKGISDEDHYMKTLQAASISEDNYFNNLLGNDVVKIAKDIRDAHSKDAETCETTTLVDDILDSFEELKTAGNATQAQMVMYSKLFKINFTKMDPYEFKTFTDILQRYSDLCKPAKGSGRGKKKNNAKS